MKSEKRFFLHQRICSYWIMVIPALVWMLAINIVPMFGIIMAFQDFNPGAGIFRSEFVGLENFEYMFQMKDVGQIFINTIVIAVGKLVLNVVVPVMFALLLNEIKIGSVPSAGDRNRRMEGIWIQCSGLSCGFDRNQPISL